jgi:phenylacetate-CoA ligase
MALMHFVPRFRKATRELATLADRETWPRSRIEAFQLERLNQVWQHAILHVPYYRRLHGERGMPSRFASLREFREAVPALPKATVRDHREWFISELPGPGHWEFTSGSTGTTTWVYWTHEAHLANLRCQYRFWDQWGTAIFDRCAYVRGHSFTHVLGLASHLKRLKQPWIDWLRNRLRIPAYYLSASQLDDALKHLQTFRPVWMYAFTTAAYVLAQTALARQFHCDSLKWICLSSETIFPHVRQTVRRAFGVPVASEYGAVECGFLAGEGPDGTQRVREDQAYVETMPGDDGRHDILVTVLSNPSFPLVRFAVGDVTDAPVDYPDRGFAILPPVGGRVNDLVISRTGRFVYHFTFDAFLETLSPIQCWQVHQRSDGSLAVLVAKPDPTAALDELRLQRKLQEMVDGYPVHLEVRPSIPRTGAGKHRWIFSDLYTRKREETFV